MYLDGVSTLVDLPVGWTISTFLNSSTCMVMPAILERRPLSPLICILVQHVSRRRLGVLRGSSNQKHWSLVQADHAVEVVSRRKTRDVWPPASVGQRLAGMQNAVESFPIIAAASDNQLKQQVCFIYFFIFIFYFLFFIFYFFYFFLIFF